MLWQKHHWSKKLEVPFGIRRHLSVVVSLRQMMFGMAARLGLAPALTRAYWALAKALGASPPPPPPHSYSAARFHEALFAGFGLPAVKKLELLKTSRHRIDVADAAAAIAFWHSSNGDHQSALDNLIIRRLAAPAMRSEPTHLVREVHALLELGRLEQAERVIRIGIERLGEVAELCGCAANAALYVSGCSPPEMDQNRIRWLSRPLQNAGLAPLVLKNETERFALGNIEGGPLELHPRRSEASISVLMPAFNAESTIATAVESILRQTWSNLELIVVDDGSSDDTWAIIEAFASRDERIVPLRHGFNRGAYIARNTAVRQATGTFVTVQDSDDWSHPERLALQAVDMLDSDHIINTTMLMRVYANLKVFTKARGSVLLENHSSLMTRTAIALELGGWDEARFGSDGEFYNRLLTCYGVSPNIVHPGTFLSLSRISEKSLTRQEHISLDTIHFGARRQYREAYRYWHQSEQSKPSPDFAMRPNERRFPIPRICKEAPRDPVECDILFVSDFSQPGGIAASSAGMLSAASSIGAHSVCFHWPLLESCRGQIDLRVRKLLHEELAANVVAGERVRTKVVIVTHPCILNQLPGMLPEVKTDACVLVVDQAPTKGGRHNYDTANIVANCRSVFGVLPTLAPISPVARRILNGAIGDASVAPVDWSPIVAADEYDRVRSLRDRTARAPVIGRHSRDDIHKWPSTPEVLRQAYCADVPFQVRLLGGAGHATRILKELPSNWTVLPFDAEGVPDFLGSIDFFVHYPHEEHVEAFSRVAAEAMAAGVPAVLPPRFAETFGSAAIYVDPIDVAGTISSLWADRSAYETQAQSGYDFVRRSYSENRFAELIRPYLS